jgi:hypothetical protein
MLCVDTVCCVLILCVACCVLFVVCCVLFVASIVFSEVVS